MERITPISGKDDDVAAREQGGEFLPKFDSAGLLTAVAQDAATGEVLMVAFMDAEALVATRATGFAHFHSRSRGRLWKKGESSGHVLAVLDIKPDKAHLRELACQFRKRASVLVANAAPLRAQANHPPGAGGVAVVRQLAGH